MRPLKRALKGTLSVPLRPFCTPDLRSRYVTTGRTQAYCSDALGSASASSNLAIRAGYCRLFSDSPPMTRFIPVGHSMGAQTRLST